MDSGTYYCNGCKIDWPVTVDYEKCPYCQRSTVRRYSDSPTFTYDEAEVIRKKETFERRYEKHKKDQAEETYQKFAEIVADQFDEYKGLDSLWPR